MIEFKCRHCATKYALKSSLAGRTAECKTCGRRFVVPYASPVVRLGDEDVAEDEIVDMAEAPKPVPLRAAKADTTPRSFSEYGVTKKRDPRPAYEPLLPMPAIASELWLPLGLSLVCLGPAFYVALDSVLRSGGSVGGLVLIAVGVASLWVIAVRLTLRSLEGAALTFDLKFSDAIFLQTLACVSVPILAGVLGLLYGGLVGMAVAVVGGSLLCPLLMTVVLQMPAGRGLQSGLLASLAFVAGYACSALLVWAVGNVMYTFWSVDLPWKVHETQTLALAAPAAVPGTQPTLTPTTPPAVQPVAVPTAAVPAMIEVVKPTVAATAPTMAASPDAVAAAGAPSASALSSAVPPAVSKSLAPPPPRADSFVQAPPAELAVPLQSALGLLAAGKYADAAAGAKTFQDTLPRPVGRITDKAYIASLEIQAAAMIKLGQPGRATPLLQRLLDSGVADRSVVINHAVCDILQKPNAIRAVKNLKTFAAAHPDDELAVTLWGVALDTAAKRQKLTRMDEQADDYVRANALLERNRPGQHHWGTRWLGSSEWQTIEQQRRMAQSNVDDATRRLSTATADFDQAQSEARRLNVVVVGRRLSDYDADILARRQRAAADTVDRRRRDVDVAKAALDQATKQLPKPTWEMDLQPLFPEL